MKRVTNTQAPALPGAPSESQVEDNFQHRPDEEPMVEHLTINGFMRRIPHRWSLVDIDRFGREVGRAAEAIHLAYVPVVDRSLGVLRSFPLPLLKRIYDILAPQYKWPQVVDVEAAVPAEPAAIRAALRIRQHLVQHLRGIAEGAAESELRASARVILQFTERECESLKTELAAAELAERHRIEPA